MDIMNSALSSGQSNQADKLEKQNAKLFQLCRVCLEVILGPSDHDQLKGVECDCESGSKTRDHIQHFLEHFVHQEEFHSTANTNGINSSIVNHFKELLGNINSHEHKHTSINFNNNNNNNNNHHHHHHHAQNKQQIFLQPQNNIKNRKKVLQNASSVLSLNTMLQQDSQNADSIRRLFEFFKMQQESNRNIIRFAYRQNYVESRFDNNNTKLLNCRPKVCNTSTAMNGDKKITMIHSNSAPKFTELALFCGSNDAENGMDLTNCYCEPAIDAHREERLLSSSARFSVGSLSDGDDDDDDGNASDSSSQYETDSDPAICDSYDSETDIDQIMSHIHSHNWFVLPNEAHVGATVYDELMKNVIDPNNIVGELNTLLSLWRNRFHLNCGRKHFLYQVMRFLFEKYVKVSYCLEHQPPCKPTVKYELFNSIATQILKQFCEHINRTRHMVIQIELLAAIESFIYNRPHFRPAIGDIFNQLFTSGVIEATAFLEWGKLQDPSSFFQSLLPVPTPSLPIGKSERSLSTVSSKSSRSMKLFSKLSKRFSLGSNSAKATNSSQKYFPKKSSESDSQLADQSLTNRDKLFDEMRNSFPLFKKNRSY